MNMLNITGACEAQMVSPLYCVNWLHALLPIHLPPFNSENSPSFSTENLLLQILLLENTVMFFEKS